MRDRSDWLPVWVGDDGASASEDLFPIAESVDIELLLEAWLLERTHRVECSLLLGRVRRLLARIVSEATLTPRRERQARQILRIIEELDRADGADLP